MSLENCGVFWLLKEVALSENQNKSKDFSEDSHIFFGLFSEGPRVKFPRSTHPRKSGCFLGFERGDFRGTLSSNCASKETLGRDTHP